MEKYSQTLIEIDILNNLIKYVGKIDVIKQSKYNSHLIHRNIGGINGQRVGEAINSVVSSVNENLSTA